MGVQTMMMFIRDDVDMASWPKPKTQAELLAEFGYR
jgi:hypothetical protein